MKRFSVFCACVLATAAALATPPNTPVLDGRPIEYDAGDLRGTFQGASTWGDDGTITNLYVTWDATYLYVALQSWQYANNKMVVLLDIDPGEGTGATTTTNWTGHSEDYLAWNGYGWIDGSGDFGLDYMIASEGSVNNIIRVLYDGDEAPTTGNTESLYDRGNDSTPIGSPVYMASHSDTTACRQKGFEARIPWSMLYVGGRWGEVLSGETVPRGATIRILAGVHNNNPESTYSSPDAIPNQPGGTWDAGILAPVSYIDVVVDGTDGPANGIPDMFIGDWNAPWIRGASGSVGNTNVLVAFNETVTQASAENTANWSVGGSVPSSAVRLRTDLVQLGLSAPIASTALLPIVANGVQDADGNTRPVEHCLFPAPNGIPQPVSVTFVVNTNSGMGISASHSRPNAFFVNGSSLPLEWGYRGYPPHESTSLAAIPGSNGWASTTVTFPVGTPSSLSYKYSGRITGTNTYEAIRLTGFAGANRPLTLNDSGTPITVVDYLGAAAYPLRNPGDTNLPTADNRLFNDVRRGDAGVRHRREILFQLDLSMRNTNNISRVMVLGSDPLRGFNSIGDPLELYSNDYPQPEQNAVEWNIAGIQLFDDGTFGDEVAGDGIYSRLWAFSTNGIDSAIVPGTPNSLVGGVRSQFFPEFIPGTLPYEGTRWINRRSPRSLIYKFYVLTTDNNHYDSPSYDLDYYMMDPDDTARIDLAPWVWDHNAIPPKPPENAPIPLGVTQAGTTATLQFENLATETSHGVRISTNLLGGFENYGHRAIMGTLVGDRREWSATIAQISGTKEFYAPYAGVEPDPAPTFWEPSYIPADATTWRVHFSQFKSNLKGGRSLAVTGPFAGWGSGVPMTFLGNGHWVADVELPAGTSGTALEFKFRNGDTWLDGANLRAVRGGTALWTPDQPTPGELFTLDFDVAGTPIAAATNVNVHMGFDAGWSETSSRPMTNLAGTVWQYATVVPTNYVQSVNWVFNAYTNGSTNLTWYSPADWKAFFSTFVNP